MKELSVSEIEMVSGAGWLQDGLASLGGKVGAAVWSTGSSLLSVDLPFIGNVNLSTIAPDLGKNLGENLGSTVGGQIENTLAGLPFIGGLLNKLLGN